MYDRYQGLIFDLDGTLLNTDAAYRISWEAIFKRYNMPYVPEQLVQYNGMPTWMIMQRLLTPEYQHLDPVVLSAEKSAIARPLLFEMTSLLPTVEIVKQYYGKRPLAVGTGSTHALAEKLLKHFDLYDYFDVIVGADDVTEHKPSPETFLSCAAKINVAPQHCIVFEDGVLGMQAATAANMAVVDVRKQNKCK